MEERISSGDVWRRGGRGAFRPSSTIRASGEEAMDLSSKRLCISRRRPRQLDGVGAGQTALVGEAAAWGTAMSRGEEAAGQVGVSCELGDLIWIEEDWAI